MGGAFESGRISESERSSVATGILTLLQTAGNDYGADALVDSVVADAQNTEAPG